ncbi:MAG: hypothetical protein K2W94_05140 [Alphaproteobacteria bacterium]|nr:hypothetical protein [Alphaproteobacteria bacterium]
MKILKAVALLAVGFSLVGSGWSMAAKDLPGACAKETNPGPCGHAANRGCSWNGKCVPNCQKLQSKDDCEAVKVNNKPHCKWFSAGNQGLCRAN